MWRLCWQFKHNGSAGHGEYMSLALAWAWLEHSKNDKEYGHQIDYWIETKP